MGCLARVGGVPKLEVPFSGGNGLYRGHIGM